jgi:redox-sensitive bicupin YhaK (pirin superfamily)
MPAITADPIKVPRVAASAATATPRPAIAVVDAPMRLEGEGFQVRRPFPGIDLSIADPFLLLDHLGAVEYAPGEAKGAPDHPHRGFETVTYIMDGAIEHRDSQGGGGLISDGGTQWMTAGAGIVHSEMPPQWLVQRGGLFHGVQLWVNLPATLKFTPARYQDIDSTSVGLAASTDGGALVRVIAGELGGVAGPGVTWTPIAYGHATLQPGARLELPWRPDFNALVYALAGSGRAGVDAEGNGGAAFREGQLVVLGDGRSGDSVTVQADLDPWGASPTLEILLLGGLPIREPIVAYGPFVMNSREEILDAIRDYQAGRMGVIPPLAGVGSVHPDVRAESGTSGDGPGN